MKIACVSNHLIEDITSFNGVHDEKLYHLKLYSQKPHQSIQGAHSIMIRRQMLTQANNVIITTL